MKPSFPPRPAKYFLAGGHSVRAVVANPNASWTAEARRSRDTSFAPAQASRKPAHHPPPPVPISAFSFPHFSFCLSLPTITLSLLPAFHPATVIIPSKPTAPTIFFWRQGAWPSAKTSVRAVVANPNASWTAEARRSRDTSFAPAQASRKPAHHPPPPVPISAFAFSLLPTIPPQIARACALQYASRYSGIPANAPASWSAVALHRFSPPRR